MNFLKSLTLISDLTHKPNFFITHPQVGPLMSKVKNAQPAIKNKLMIRVLTGTA